MVAETGSTNDDLAEAGPRRRSRRASCWSPRRRRRGRGRLDRTWTSPPRAGLLFSVLLRPRLPVSRRTWIPLLAGLAVQQAVARLGAVDTRLKWPNDLLLGDDLGKAGGILAQAAGDAVVVGVGLNVSTRRAELPAGGVSLATEARRVHRSRPDPAGESCAPSATATATGQHDGRPVRPAYERVCDTVGREVRVRLPDGGGLTGTATGLDEAGRLVVRTDGRRRAGVRRGRHPGPACHRPVTRASSDGHT